MELGYLEMHRFRRLIMKLDVLKMGFRSSLETDLSHLEIDLRRLTMKFSLK